TISKRDWSSDVCSSDLGIQPVRFDSIDVVSGAGVEGNANGQKYELISQKALGNEIAVDVPKGATLSVLVENEKPIGTVALGDERSEERRVGKGWGKR